MKTMLGFRGASAATAGNPAIKMSTYKSTAARFMARIRRQDCPAAKRIMGSKQSPPRRRMIRPTHGGCHDGRLLPVAGDFTGRGNDADQAGVSAAVVAVPSRR